MFKSLSGQLTGIFDRLRKKGVLGEADIDGALREIRVSLLEADVALPVVKEFIADVKEKALGQQVIQSVTPGQMVVKIVHGHLVRMLGDTAVPLHLNATPPVVFLLVGLQGSGKTTSTGKLAVYLEKKHGKKVLMASTDIYRPAAQQQLRILGEQAGIATLPIIAGQKPLEITGRALEAARLQGFDILLLDTAGRLHVDEVLMREAVELEKLASPLETLLVVDAMTGQDAVNVAAAYKKALPLSGLILTRIDSDARGGAALSVRAVTGCPIKMLGVGEKPDALEEFHPQRIADRILGMGDILSLVEKATETVDRQEAEKMAAKLQKGKFDLEDLLAQFRQMKKLGSLGSLIGMVPGLNRFQDKLQSVDTEKMLKRQEAVILSMTPYERRHPKILNASRKRRIAKGCGQQVQDVNRLLKQHEQMGQMMKQVGRMDKTALARLMKMQP